MSSTNQIYVGPGKVYYGTPGSGGFALHPEGENGPVKITFNEVTKEISSAMFGRHGELVLDQNAEVETVPFSDWLLLAALYPASIGADTSAISNGAAAALAVGSQPFGVASATGQKMTKMWGYDGRIITLSRTALIQHPTLMLAPDKPLFGGVKILAAGAYSTGTTAIALGSSGYLFASNAITEPGANADPGVAAADPGGIMSMTNFVQGMWTGVWGSVTGFDAIQGEEGWEIIPEVKYSIVKLNQRTLTAKLDSVAFMAKCRPFGPTMSQVIGAVGGHTQGQLLGSASLTLTGPGTNHTIVLTNAEIKGAGFEFGGTGLSQGEIGFVNKMSFTSGAPTSLITFGAGA